MAGYSVNGREDLTRVKPHERRQRILDRVLEYDSVTVDDLADEFGLTKMSVRRDLNALAENGQVARVRGGATRRTRRCRPAGTSTPSSATPRPRRG